MRDIFQFKARLSNLRSAAKNEYDETVVAGEILFDILNRKKATPEEIRFLKDQSIDVLKVLGVVGLGAVTSLIPIALHRLLKPYGINIFPNKHQIPPTRLNEYMIFLDDERDVNDVYDNADDFVSCKNVEEFKVAIERRGLPSFISFDHDLGEKDGVIVPSGLDAAKWLVYDHQADIRGMKYKSHSSNIQTREQITGLLDNWKRHLDSEDDALREGIKAIISGELLNEERRVPFAIEVPDEIRAINNLFIQAGYQLYLVGGCVRDAVMGTKPKDFDLATDALPDQVEALMGQHGYKTLPTGKAFGIINVITDEDTYEIATFRLDRGATDGRRPDSVEFTDMKQDANRRDLSINALFYDITRQEVIDFVGGLDDIENKVVRTVGNAADRFQEDKLRIMRAVRFSARMGHAVSDDIDSTLKANSSMEGVSAERVRDEFLKGIQSAKSVRYFLELLDRYDLFKSVFPSTKVNQDFIEERDPLVLIAWLLMDNGIDKATSVLQSAKYSFNEVKGVKFLIGLRGLSPQSAFLLKKAEANSGISSDQIRKFGEYIKLPGNILSAFIRFKLSVTGADLEKQGIPSGPQMGVAIKDMETRNFSALL